MADGALFDALAERLALLAKPFYGHFGKDAVKYARADVVRMFADLGPSEGAARAAAGAWRVAYFAEQGANTATDAAVEAAWRHDLGVDGLTEPPTAP